jgi:alcohol dehydrogenase class IV
MRFDHVTLSQRVLFGAGAALDNIESAFATIGGDRALLISDSDRSPHRHQIPTRIPVVARIDEVVQHVPAERARSAVALARDNEADSVVAFGGGSTIGLAKIIAKDAGIPIIAVPTTFAGSEATNVWGLTEQGRKVTGVDDSVLPRAVIYDASLLASLPTQLKIASGLNAVAHAVDAFWAPRADPLNRALGTEGLRALLSGLRALRANEGDLSALEQTLYGAYLAAVAFASAGSGLHHKICHALGGTYNLPHAETHAVVLPYVTAFNAAFADDAAQRIAGALATESAAVGLYSTYRWLGAPASLRELGLREGDIPEAVRIILPAVPPSNPRPVTPDGLETLLRAAWAGDPIESQGAN